MSRDSSNMRMGVEIAAFEWRQQHENKIGDISSINVEVAASEWRTREGETK